MVGVILEAVVSYLQKRPKDLGGDCNHRSDLFTLESRLKCQYSRLGTTRPGSDLPSALKDRITLPGIRKA